MHFLLGWVTMGNIKSSMNAISSASVLESSDEDEEGERQLIRIKSLGNKLIAVFGNPVQDQDSTNSDQNNVTLLSLFPYLTYCIPLNTINNENKLDPLSFIAYIINEYIQINMNQTMDLKVSLESVNSISAVNIISNSIRPSIFTNMLCGCSWNSKIYLINPINNSMINSNIYTIHNNQHRIDSQLALSTIKYDPNLCCAISCIPNKDSQSIDKIRNSAMIIDGVIMINSDLNTIYGHSIINGLYKIKKFKKTDAHNDIERFEVIINLWRQNLDAFVLTSKFNLYGIRITQKGFAIKKICQFEEALQDIDDIHDSVDYVDSCYDIDTKQLLLIYKDVNAQSVRFKVYKSDRSNATEPKNEVEDDDDDLGLDDAEVEYETPGGPNDSDKDKYNVKIPKELQECLDQYYFLSAKSFLFYHLLSESLLLVFNGYIVQFKMDFVQKKLIMVNIGIVEELEKKTKSLMMKEMKSSESHSQSEDMKLDEENMNVCDAIIGYDEYRSCLILNLKECSQELSLLYKFRISIIRLRDVVNNWKRIL